MSDERAVAASVATDTTTTGPIEVIVDAGPSSSWRRVEGCAFWLG
jgi:hypothetical protein